VDGSGKWLSRQSSLMNKLLCAPALSRTQTALPARRNATGEGASRHRLSLELLGFLSTVNMPA
jgi:hypothetical protein